MSQSEMRRATTANAAPVTTAGVWMLPYNPRKVEDPPSGAIASFHIQQPLQQTLLLDAEQGSTFFFEMESRGAPDLREKKILEKSDAYSTPPRGKRIRDELEDWRARARK